MSPKTETPETPETPVTVYVVHHPGCVEAEQIASKLHDWFRLGHLTGDSGEAGIPVHFRRRLNGNHIHPVIDFDQAEFNVVIALVDELAVADNEWRSALANLANEIKNLRDCGSTNHSALLLPVALHESFYRVSPIYQQFNPVRLMDMPPDQMLETIRRAATEATARNIRSLDSPNPAPLDVFLSHAKSDGKKIAEGLRDRVRSFGQMIPWYDANDLPFGSNWESPMKQAAKNGTAAMIAVVTDAYSTRPWCRKEASLARTPVKCNPKSDRVWQVQPVVAVHNAEENWVRSIPMLQGVPRIGWHHELQDTARVVDRLGLEVLLGFVHRRVASRLEDKLKNRRDVCFITWVPDAWTLSALRHQLGEKALGIRSIVYPGFGLTTVEMAELEPILKCFHNDTKLVSFEQVWTDGTASNAKLEPPKTSRPISSKKSLLIGLSAGGIQEELSDHGYGLEHINELMVRISRRLLSDGHQLAFGGTLGDSDNTLTDSLIDAALGWIEDEAAKRVEITKPSAWPLVNYSPWPFHTRVTTERRASLVGICRFENVDPDGVAPEDLQRELDAWNASGQSELTPLGSLYYANALTAMRKRAAIETDMRIVWGGSLAATGWMPGILEEVNHSVSSGKPVLVLGGFGGCGSQIARLFRQKTKGWPKKLPTICHDQNRDALLTAKEAAARQKETEETKNRLMRYAERLHNENSVEGISTVVLREALNIVSTRHAISLAAYAAKAVSESPDDGGKLNSKSRTSKKPLPVSKAKKSKRPKQTSNRRTTKKKPSRKPKAD